MADRNNSRRVSHPPPRPLMIFDGDCHFCSLWIQRWREQTGGEVDYEPFQGLASRFPEIAPVEFTKALIFVLPNGDVFGGAAAVFQSLAFAPRRRWLLALYRKLPGFSAVSEIGYRVIARNRKVASALTHLFWGSDVRRPTYFITRRVFLRALGLVYVVAFGSLWLQVDGLIGEHGVLPAQNFFSAVGAEYGARAFFALPSLCWLNSSNTMLHALCGMGVLASIIVMIGFVPIVSLLVCFVTYLSLTIAGQTFLSFQWDILLLEAGFLAIFLAPFQWRLGVRSETGVSTVALFLLKFLLFKLMFMSGVVKLTSGDDCWANLTALDYHYWTQPLPTVWAFFGDKHPEWFKKFSVAFCLFVEIAAPFFIWAPRRLRLLAATLVVALQIAIAVTGNYCFFNLLAIALCLLLIDDATWRRARLSRVTHKVQERHHWWSYAAVVVLVFTFPLNLWLNYTAIKPEATWPRPFAVLYSYVEPFRIANGYGLFRVMTRERPEIQVEGSEDGIDWRSYEFIWKPGDVNRAPRWNAPHQPRLDWQMWFAALGGRRQETWFGNFVIRLLENEPAVTRLLARNPFPSQPPRYVRATLFKYEFTTSEERRTTAAWWKRREIGEYFPEVSLPR